MAGVIDISFLGDKQLSRKFHRMLSQKGQRNILSRTLKNVAEQYKQDAEQAIPVDTGALKTVGLAVKPIRKKNQVGHRVQTPTREELGISDDDKYYYPAHVELGHRLPNGGRVEERPFMRATMENRRKRYLAMLRRGIRQKLIREAKKKK